MSADLTRTPRDRLRTALPAGLVAGVRKRLPVGLPAGLSSVRLRATAAATLVVALALGVAAAVLVVTLRGSLEASTDAEAARRAVAAAPRLIQAVKAVQAEPAEAGSAAPLDAKPVKTEEKPGVRTEGKPGVRPTEETYEGAEADQPMGDPDVLLIGGSGESLAVTEWAQPRQYAVAALKVATADGTSTVLARASRAGAEEALRALDGALLPGVPALLGVVAAMTWFSVTRALRPVAAIRAKMADITARDLHQRVPVPRSGDEIAALATTVNGTLDRLETAVGTHQRFVADAAHELRSPIATLRARLELAPPSELTREALADVERLQALAGDLLMLARLDAGEPVRTTSLDLGQVAFEESVRHGQEKEPRVVVDIEPDVVVRGSRGHLARLVTNLLDNARRHAETAVTVRVRPGDGLAVLEVLDDGPGIPPEHREAVFDRFTRLDEARARDDGGAGLGLPIARDIAGLHGGTLVAIDGGFRATLPAST
ncbi:HAMP domain-containing sensor histidine kinase [Nonomuraea sp. NPDC005501]|uniref:sensor histidine kinase n=1 Tax=Nonomuraea sp. NPDC005501 TaxID=3156884 RepID=UPI0033AA2E6D